MTHTYFAKDVYQKLPPYYQNKINNKLEHYKLFAQGSDPYMFYHFFIGKKAKDSIYIQKQMHTAKTQDFFINIIKYIHNNNLANNQEVMTYLYGNICHYFLDLTTHPYIYYKSGSFNKKDKTTYKYNGYHQELEYNIDLYIIKQREKELPYKYKVYNNIFNTKTYSQELKNIIDYTIEQTYHYNNISTHYIKSVKQMKYFFRLINHDPTGIKLLIYSLIDKITPSSTIKLKELSYHHNFEKDLSYLNLEHSTWNYPWNKSLTSTKSFFDLYDIALNNSINTIIKSTDILEKKT